MGAPPTRADDGLAPGAWLMTGLLIATWIMAFVDRLIIMLLVPGIKQSLAITDTDIALLHGPAFSFVFAIAGLPLGRLADRVNRRNLLCVALVCWSLAEIAGGLAQSFTGLFIARMAVGVSQAALAPVGFSLIADLFPVDKRGRPAALLVSASAVGSALSNVIGGVLLQVFMARPPIDLPGFGPLAAWQTTIILSGIPGLLVAVLYVAVKEPARRNVATGPSAAGFALFPYLRRHGRVFALLFAAFSCNMLLGYGIGSWFPPLMMRSSGLTPAQTGITIGLLTLVTAFVSATFGGWLSDRVARADPDGGRLRLVSALLVVEFFTLMPLFFVPSVVAVLAAFMMFAILTSIISACSYALLPDLVPNQGRGQFIAVYQLIGNFIGLGLGPTLVAALTDRLYGHESRLNLAMLTVGLPAAALGAILIGLARPHARRLRAGITAGRI